MQMRWRKGKGIHERRAGLNVEVIECFGVSAVRIAFSLRLMWNVHDQVFSGSVTGGGVGVGLLENPWKDSE